MTSMDSLRTARRLVKVQISEWVRSPGTDELSDEYFRACADVARFAGQGSVQLVDVLSEFESIIQVLLEHAAAKSEEPLEEVWEVWQDALVLGDIFTEGINDPEERQ